VLTEKQLNRYADVLLWGLQTARNRQAAKKDLVLVRFDLKAVRLAEILYAKLLKAGAHPLLRMNPTSSMEHDYYTLANSRQLVYIPPGEEALFAGLNGSISIYAPESLTHLSKIDPKRISPGEIQLDAVHLSHRRTGKTCTHHSKIVFSPGCQGVFFKYKVSGGGMAAHL
jgi:aminopeptidase